MTWLCLLLTASGADPVVIEGSLDAVPDEPFLFLPFTVPPGVAELRFAHDDRSAANVLDWGLFGPDGFRGWHGSHGTPAVVGELAASPGYVPGPLAGDWEVIVGLPKVTELPVRWWVEITFAAAPTLPPDADVGPYVRPAPIVATPGWFAGDFHVHTVQSGDASPTMDEAVAEARRRGLDFVELSEHDTTAHLGLLAAVQARHPDILVLPGIEWTTYGGHANAIGVEAYVPFHVGARGLTARDAVDAVHAQGGLFAPNHPTLDLGDLCLGCDWAYDVPADRIDALEIQSGSVDVLGPILTTSALALWEELLDAGGRVTAIGGSDDHSGGNPEGPFASGIGEPTTYVWAEELSVNGILDGLRAGRTVVKLGGPDDPWVEIDVGATVDDVDAPAAATTAVHVRVEGGVGDLLQIVQDGAVVHTVPIREDPLDVGWGVRVTEDEPLRRVRAQVVRDDVIRTLTSHVWVAWEPPHPSTHAYRTCGCMSAGSTASPALALLGLVALRRRSRPGTRPRGSERDGPPVGGGAPRRPLLPTRADEVAS